MSTKEPKYNLIVILGPTASGKTRLAARLAMERGTEIISADSRQVYRGMDIGTGKDLSDYVIEGKTVPYHLIDIVGPDYEFSVFDYQTHFLRVFGDISKRGKVPIMVGGTGLYIEAVLRGYDLPAVPEDRKLREELDQVEVSLLRTRLAGLNPHLHNTTDLKDKKRLIRAIEIAEFTQSGGSRKPSRPPIRALTLGIRCERSLLRRRITDRLKTRLDAGMIDEIESLHQSGISWEKLEYFGLEYRYVGFYIRGILSYEEMLQKLNIRIHQYAKRQETWFRGMEKRGISIHWIEADDYGRCRDIVKSVLK